MRLTGGGHVSSQPHSRLRSVCPPLGQSVLVVLSSLLQRRLHFQAGRAAAMMPPALSPRALLPDECALWVVRKLKGSLRVPLLGVSRWDLPWQRCLNRGPRRGSRVVSRDTCGAARVILHPQVGRKNHRKGQPFAYGLGSNPATSGICIRCLHSP